MTTIFIVEDDPKISRLLESHFEKYGYRAVVADDFKNILDEFTLHQPELVLLDVNLPSYDGYYWCRQIRAVSTCPILFITARDGKMDQVMALEYGGDDYITKPFDSDIVLAKVRSHLRRAYGSYAGQGVEQKLEHAGLTLYPDRLELTLHGQMVELGRKESLLLETLLERPMHVISRDRLLEKLWDPETYVDDNTLNVYVTRVRKKLRELGIEGALETVRGTGYRLKETWGNPQ